MNNLKTYTAKAGSSIAPAFLNSSGGYTECKNENNFMFFKKTVDILKKMR